MKTLLLNLPKNLDNRFDFDQVSQPIGLASISAFLKKHGCDVTLFDAHAYHWDRRRILQYAKNIKPDVIGLTVMTYQLPVIISFMQDLKQLLPDVCVVLGGPHTAPEYRSTLESYPEVDIVVSGEGEITTLELILALESDSSLKGIPGLAYRQNGTVLVNQERDLIKDLDSLPHPDWASLPVSKYWDVFTTKKNYARIMASRGCPYSCIFCGAHISMGKKIRKRSPEHIIDELTMLYDRYHVREILFNDSTFNIDNDWVAQICEGILRMGRPLTWRCNVRADRLDKHTLQIMKKSGCVKVIMGIESGDEEILKKMKKGESLEQIRQAIHILKEVKMPSDHGFILGMPGETEESIKKTIDFAGSLDASVVTFSLGPLLSREPPSTTELRRRACW